MNKAEELQKIGLTKGEAKTYLTLSEIGTSTVGPIVKKSGISYSKIYEVLNRLIKKGIVSFIIKNKTKHFQAVSPKNLIDYIEKKKKEISKQENTLQKLIPKLENIQNLNPQQNAEIFIGKRGLKTAYEKLLKNKEKEENLFFYIHKKRYAEESDLFYFSILDLYTSVPQRGVTNILSKESAYFKNVKKFKVKYTNSSLPGNIEICKDKILMISWDKAITAVLIQSEDLANNLRSYFNDIWKKCKKTSS